MNIVISTRAHRDRHPSRSTCVGSWLLHRLPSCEQYRRFSRHGNAACAPAAQGHCSTPLPRQTSYCGSRSPRRVLCIRDTCGGGPVSSMCSGSLRGSCAHTRSCQSRHCQRARIGRSGKGPPAPSLVAYFVAPSLVLLLAPGCFAEDPPMRARPQAGAFG